VGAVCASRMASQEGATKWRTLARDSRLIRRTIGTK